MTGSASGTRSEGLGLGLIYLGLSIAKLLLSMRCQLSVLQLLYLEHLPTLDGSWQR